MPNIKRNVQTRVEENKLKKPKFEVCELQILLLKVEMDSLPDEVLQQILDNVPFNELATTIGPIERLSSVCDWNFWAGKAIRDFKVSRTYFDLPLATLEKEGRFNDIPYWNQRSRRMEYFGRQEMGTGAFRYFQIASRISLLPDFLASSGSQGFIEDAAFFLRAKKGNQFSTIPFLVENIPVGNLTYYLNCFMPLSELFSGKLKCLSEENFKEASFDLGMFSELVSPRVYDNTFENLKSTIPFLELALEVEKGKIPDREEVGKLKEPDIDNFVFILNQVLTSNPNRGEILTPLWELVEELIQKNPYSGVSILYSALISGNSEVVEKILSVRNYLTDCDEDGQLYAKYYNLPRAAVHSGNIQLLRTIVGQNLENFSLESYEDVFVDGYLLNRNPEKYLEFLHNFEILPKRLIHQICQLGDCDMISYLLSRYENQHKDQTPLKNAVQFFSKYIEHCFGYLDVVTWAIRVLRSRMEGERKSTFCAKLRPLKKLAIKIQTRLATQTLQYWPTQEQFSIPDLLLKDTKISQRYFVSHINFLAKCEDENCSSSHN